MARLVASRTITAADHSSESQKCEHDRHDQETDADDIAVDRDRAQTVCHERNEIHARAAAKPLGPIGRNHAVWLARSENGGRVVIPDLGHHDQAREPPARDGAEVADPYALAGQETMKQLEQRVKHAENERLRSPRPFGEDDRSVSRFLESFEQPGNVRGIILAVAVHDHDRAGRKTVFDVSKTNGDRSLMAQVSPQAQHIDPAQSRERPALERSVGFNGRAVVDDENVDREKMRRQDRIQLRKQLGQRGPIVENRDQDDGLAALVLWRSVVD